MTIHAAEAFGTVGRDANYEGVWGHRVGFGKNPALLLIDFVQAYTLDESPLFAAGVAPALHATRGLLEKVRDLSVPVIHTTVRHHSSGLDGGTFLRKSPVLNCLAEPRFIAPCEGVEPLATEIVVVKQYASAFFGTSLASTLHAAGIDTLILAGCSTSGCIRASAVDGVQHGFRVIVPRECVGDRHPTPHEANLFDINSKYGDVVGKQEVFDHLARRAERSPS